MKTITEQYNKTLTWAYLRKKFAYKKIEKSALKIFKCDLAKCDNQYALKATIKLLDNKFTLKSLCKEIERDIESYTQNLALIANKILCFREIISEKIVSEALKRDLIEPVVVLKAWDYVPPLIISSIKSKKGRISEDFLERLEKKEADFEYPKFVYRLEANDSSVCVFDVLNNCEISIEQMKNKEYEWAKIQNKNLDSEFWIDFEFELKNLIEIWERTDKNNQAQVELFENDLLNAGKLLCMRMMSVKMPGRVVAKVLDESTEIFGYFVAEDTSCSLWDIEGVGICFECIETDIGFKIGFYDLDREIERYGDGLDDMIWMKNQIPSNEEWEYFESLAKQLRDLLPNYVVLGFGWY